MIDFNLDEKQIEERMKELKEGCSSWYAYLFFPELKKCKTVYYSELSTAFRDDVRIIYAYKIIGRAMVFGACEFQAVGGALCKLFRNDEDFCLVFADAMTEKNFKDSLDLCKELIKLL